MTTVNTGSIISSPGSPKKFFKRKVHYGEDRDSDCVRLLPHGVRMVVHPHRNRIEEVRGDRSHPSNRGALCPKGRQFPNSCQPGSAHNPLLKTSSGFKPVSWEEALALMADRLEDLKAKHGPQTLVRFRGAPCPTPVKRCLPPISGSLRFLELCGVSHLLFHS